MEFILHALGLCHDSMFHLDLLDMRQIPIIELINLYKNGR
jgi:hypothetical protein